MVKLFLFAALLLAVTAREVNFESEKDLNIVGSLRIYPNFIHKCSTFYLYLNVMMTTAKCVKGFENNPKSMRVLINSRHLAPDENSVTLEVLSVHIDGRYNGTEAFNLALIEVGFNRDQRKIFRLDTTDLMAKNHTRSNIYSWHYNQSLRDYALTSIRGRILTSEVCSEIIEAHLPPHHFCVETDGLNSLGPFDEGTPVLTEEGKIRGIQTNLMEMEETRIFVYYHVRPSFPWINQVIASLHDDYENYVLHITPVVDAAAALGRAIIAAFAKLFKRR